MFTAWPVPPVAALRRLVASALSALALLPVRRTATNTVHGFANLP